MRRNPLKRLFLAAAVLTGVGAATGCSTYRIGGFQDHGTHNATMLQMHRTTDYYLWSTAEHQFWMCRDEENRLVCSRQCGGDTDLECPSAGASAIGGITTNVR